MKMRLGSRIALYGAWTETPYPGRAGRYPLHAERAVSDGDAVSVGIDDVVADGAAVAIAVLAS